MSVARLRQWKEDVQPIHDLSAARDEVVAVLAVQAQRNSACWLLRWIRWVPVSAATATE
jgi:hypothetical protein